MPTPDLVLATLILVAALVYSAVGHGGASGYLAAMALVGLAPTEMRPAALVLNVLVASIGTWKFARAGHFTGRLFWPLVAASIPAAFLGGTVQLPTVVYKRLLGIVLLWAAARFVWRPLRPVTNEKPPPAALVGIGAAIGLLSGLTGVGGGIFLSPLLLVLGWVSVQQASGLAAPFIVVNSVAGLAGLLVARGTVPAPAALWAVAAAAGGLVGAELGSRRLSGAIIARVLAGVLVVAGLKMLLT